MDFSHFWKKGINNYLQNTGGTTPVHQVVFEDPVGVRESKFDMNQVLEYRSTSLGFVGPCE